MTEHRRIGVGLFTKRAGVSNREMDERIRVVVERERRHAFDSTMTVRWVAPRPQPEPVKVRQPTPMPNGQRVTTATRRVPLVPKALGVPHAPPVSTTRGKVLIWLAENGPSTSVLIGKALGIKVSYVNVHLVQLRDRGLVERTGRKLPSPDSRAYTEWRVPEGLA